MTEPYAFLLKAKTRADKADAFELLFRAAVQSSRAERGCIEYHMLRDKNDPSLFVFFEVWASEADFQEHLKKPHMVTFAEQRTEYLEADFDIQSIEMLSPASSSR